MFFWIFDKEKLLVLYLTAAAIENQWLPSCMFDFDKIYMTGRMVDDEWLKN